MDATSALLIVVLAGAVIYLMTVMGVDRSALEWKRDPRICRSCGRDLDDCLCHR